MQQRMQVFPSRLAALARVLVGNAIGDGLIVDFSRHNRQIAGLDLEKRSIPRRRPICAGSTQRLSKAARFLFRSGRRNQFARYARRNHREQFLWRALPNLRHNGRSRFRSKSYWLTAVLKKLAQAMTR